MHTPWVQPGSRSYPLAFADNVVHLAKQIREEQDCIGVERACSDKRVQDLCMLRSFMRPRLRPCTAALTREIWFQQSAGISQIYPGLEQSALTDFLSPQSSLSRGRRHSRNPRSMSDLELQYLGCKRSDDCHPVPDSFEPPASRFPYDWAQDVLMIAYACFVSCGLRRRHVHISPSLINSMCHQQHSPQARSSSLRRWSGTCSCCGCCYPRIHRRNK